MRLNWFNYLYLPIDGYGRMGLHLVKALLRAGHNVNPHITADLNNPAWMQRAQGIDFSNATVMLLPPHEARHIPGRNFIYTMHESMNLPDGWVDHVNSKAQWLLVPSPWLVDLFRDSGVMLPIDVVKGGIDPAECPILNYAGSASRPYTFGALADRGYRKGWDAVYMAFYKAFDHNNRDVRLILKCRPGSLPPSLDFSYSSDQRLTIWSTDVAEIADVYAQFDAFMFPSRCEGLGMPPLESAACGIPTVVQRFSGTADDCDDWAVQVLENFTMVESHMEKCGGEWAEPDEDELIEAMRWLYYHQDEAKAKALKSAQWLRNNRTYDHSAARMTEVLGVRLGHPVIKPDPLPMDNRTQAANWLPVLSVTKAPASNGHKNKEVVR